MAQILPHLSRERLMLQAIKEKNTERRHKILHELIKGHAAVADLPVVFFTADFMDMYPDAKVVLNSRPSAEIWSKSSRSSLGFFFTQWFRWSGMLWPNDRLWWSMNIEARKLTLAKFGTDDVFSADMYNAYYADVREEARKRGREVLEFKAEDGWKPLCEFLGKDVPERPFPRVNEARVFRMVKAIIITRGVLTWVALGAGIWFASKLVRSYL